MNRELDALADKPAAGGSDFNLLRWFHCLMRGRYHWAVLLALCLGGGAGYYLYQQVVPIYEARGNMRIRAYTPKLLYGNEASGEMPNFQTFMEEQLRTLRSERLVAMAMESDHWRSLDQPFTPEAQADFRSRLHVWRSNELIGVSFKHEQPRVAEVATRSVIEAYQRLFHETDPTQDRARMQILDESRRALTNELNSIQDQVASFGDAFGPDGVKFQYQETVNRLRDLEEAIRSAEIALGIARARLEETPPMPSMSELRENNPRLDRLAKQMDDYQIRMRELKRVFPDGHSAVRAHQERMQHMQRRIDDAIAVVNLDDYHRAWNEQWSEKTAALEAEQKDLASRLEAGKRELRRLSEEKNRLQRLELEAEQVESKLAQVRSRIEQLNFESRLSERLVVYEYGEARSRPINADEPRKQAMMGGFAGGSVGWAIVMLIGLANPRLRRSEDLTAAQGPVKVLGMLPQLPDRLDDPEETYFAAQCVHQLRMFLQLEGTGDDIHSFVVTGPEAGTGKTSLTMALGFSYAAADAKVLLVDFDLIGAGLTSRLGGRRRRQFGQLLRDEGLVDDEVIESIVREDLDGRLGERLVARGLINPEDVQRVLELQRRSRVGLLDVLSGEPLERCVEPLPSQNLSLLPVGNATASHISRVGRAAVKRFIKDVRTKYDVVLIDTGPVPGSVEASLIAAEADRVILTVSRGDEMRRLNECQAFLRSVGARLAGVVFNRADKRDMIRSRYSLSSSIRSSSIDRRRDASARQVGPLALASAGETYSEPMVVSN